MFLSSFFLGLFASVLHVISGPDHIAAVTPLVINTNKKVWKIGFAWGIGHLTGMLLIGVLFLIFKDLIPVQKISGYSEQIVGFMLIVIGVWAYYKFLNDKEHVHPHIHTENETYVHVHKHSHTSAKVHSHLHKKAVEQNIYSAFGVGVIHGLAGVAHFLLLLPVLSFNSNIESVQYILGFGVGTVAAMTVYAFLLGRFIGFSHTNKKNLKAIRFAGGTFAIVVGVYWIFSSQVV